MIGVYSKRNLCFVAGRSTTFNCLNVVFVMPSVLTKSILVAGNPERFAGDDDLGRRVPEGSADLDVIFLARGRVCDAGARRTAREGRRRRHQAGAHRQMRHEADACAWIVPAPEG